MAVGELPLHLNTGGELQYVWGATLPLEGVRAPFSTELAARFRVFTDARKGGWAPYGGGNWSLTLLPAAVAAAFELSGRDAAPAHVASGFVALEDAPPAMRTFWRQLAPTRSTAGTAILHAEDMHFYWDGEVWRVPPVAWPAAAGAPLAGTYFDLMTAFTDGLAADGGAAWCAQWADSDGEYACDFLWRRALEGAAFEWYAVGFAGSMPP